MKREWKESMGEISGFGGGYEAVCRAMVLAGIEWLDEHPEADPSVKSLKNVYGLAMAENEDAKALEKAMMDAPVYLNGKLLQKQVRDDCTGAMHHAAVSHCFAYKRLGWQAYSSQLEAGEEEESKTK